LRPTVHRAPRAGRLAAILLIILVAVANAGCRSSGRSLPRTLNSLEGTQALYRVQFAHRKQRDSGRLTLRSWSESDFVVEVRDAFGRGLWRLRVADDVAWIADLQHRRICSVDPDRSLLRTEWAGLSPRRLPRILLGLPPVHVTGASHSGGHAATRQTTTVEGEWRLTWRRGVLDRWSLWRSGRPALWWQREAAGGVLSGPSGAQLRWRLKVAEPLTARDDARGRPTAFEEVRCEDLALP
jgi:hypothetical protein